MQTNSSTGSTQGVVARTEWAATDRRPRIVAMTVDGHNTIDLADHFAHATVGPDLCAQAERSMPTACLSGLKWHQHFVQRVDGDLRRCLRYSAQESRSRGLDVSVDDE